jgi:hypothetical protein
MFTGSAGFQNSQGSMTQTVNTDCCPDNPVPATLFATFSNGTGDCTCLNGVSVQLDFFSGQEWDGDYTACSGSNTLKLSCSPFFGWQLSSEGGCQIVITSPTTSNCSPFSLHFNGLAVSNCCSGTVDGDAMTHPRCNGQHPGREARPGPYSLDQCRLCWLALNDSAYRQEPPAVPDPPPHASRSLPCLHLGEVIDRLGCPCPGRWLRQCGVHGTTTVQQCKQCPDYEEDDAFSPAT